MSRLNLKSSMQDDVVYKPADAPPPPPTAPVFDFPMSIAKEASDFNTLHEELHTKLYGRQLAGYIVTIANMVEVLNKSAIKAANTSQNQLRGSTTPTSFMVHTINAYGQNIADAINESIGKLDEQLQHTETIPKKKLPPLWTSTLVTLVECGLILPPKGDLNPKMWQLPDALLVALRVKPRLPDPYNKITKEKMAAIEGAIAILEKLHPFAKKLIGYKYVPTPTTVGVVDEPSDMRHGHGARFSAE